MSDRSRVPSGHGLARISQKKTVLNLSDSVRRRRASVPLMVLLCAKTRFAAALQGLRWFLSRMAPTSCFAAFVDTSHPHWRSHGHASLFHRSGWVLR